MHPQLLVYMDHTDPYHAGFPATINICFSENPDGVCGNGVCHGVDTPHATRTVYSVIHTPPYRQLYLRQNMTCISSRTASLVYLVTLQIPSSASLHRYQRVAMNPSMHMKDSVLQQHVSHLPSFSIWGAFKTVYQNSRFVLEVGGSTLPCR